MKWVYILEHYFDQSLCGAYSTKSHAIDDARTMHKGKLGHRRGDGSIDIYGLYDPSQCDDGLDGQIFRIHKMRVKHSPRI